VGIVDGDKTFVSKSAVKSCGKFHAGDRGAMCSVRRPESTTALSLVTQEECSGGRHDRTAAIIASFVNLH
jgi:hypothetical protein